MHFIKIIRKLYIANPFLFIFVVIGQFFVGIIENIGILSIFPLLQMVSTEQLGETFPEKIIILLLNELNLTQSFEAFVLTFAIAIIAKSILSIVFRSISGILILKYIDNTRHILVQSILNAKWSFFISQPLGVYSNYLGSESLRYSSSLTSALSIIVSLLHVLLYLSSALLVSTELTFFSLLVGMALFFLLKPILKSGRKAGKEQTNSLDSVTTKLVDVLIGIKPLKAMSHEYHVLPILCKNLNKLFLSQKKQMLSILYLQNIQEPIIAIAGAILLIVMNSFFSINIAEIAVVAILFNRTISQMSVVQKRYFNVLTNQGAVDIVDEAINKTIKNEEVSGGEHVTKIKDIIEFDDVSFKYGKNVIFDRLNLDIYKNKLTLIKGRTGCGKSTLFDHLLGFVKPDSGGVKVDGVELTKIDIKSWRKIIGYVPQELNLYSESFYLNISLGDPSITEKEVLEVLDVVGAMSFISKYDNGINAMPGERGLELSGGQRQRISLARALVKKPKLLLLDEVTSALDSKTEKEICELIKKISSNITVVAISHQDSMDKIADYIYEVNDGVAKLQATKD